MSTAARWLIVGAGSFGTAISRVMGQGDGDVHLTLAARRSEHAEAMRASGTNEAYFPDVALTPGMDVATIDEACEQTWDGVVLAVPTSAFAPTVERVARIAPLFVSLGKGLDPSGRRLSEVASEHIDPARFVMLSGPNIAREMMQDLPTAAVVAGTNRDAVLHAQRVVSSRSFRVYTHDDIVGVELAGASKNVIAIAAGVMEGSGMGDNAIAAMMTRGLGEMARLGAAYGAQVHTYMGLAGVGDLMVTCRSPHSRNHRAGRLFAEGLGASEIRERIGQVVEGMRTAPVIQDMAAARGLDLHICSAVAQVVAHDVPLEDVVQQMLSRPPGDEFDGAFER